MIRVVTCMNGSIWEETGRDMVRTFNEFWPDNVELKIYSEEHFLPESFGKIYQSHLPDVEKVKKLFGSHVPKDYTTDVVKFSHKVFAVIDAARDFDGKLFWLDADVITFKQIPLEKLDEWLPDNVALSCLKRPKTYSECSFVGYNLSNPAVPLFMAAWRNLYVTAAVRYLNQWHDCMTFDVTRMAMGVKTKNLTMPDTDLMHPFVFSDLGNYMDHLKGRRKRIGHSPEHPLKWWEEMAHA